MYIEQFEQTWALLFHGSGLNVIYDVCSITLPVMPAIIESQQFLSIIPKLIKPSSEHGSDYVDFINNFLLGALYSKFRLIVYTDHSNWISQVTTFVGSFRYCLPWAAIFWQMVPALKYLAIFVESPKKTQPGHHPADGFNQPCLFLVHLHHSQPFTNQVLVLTPYGSCVLLDSTHFTAWIGRWHAREPGATTSFGLSPS